MISKKKAVIGAVLLMAVTFLLTNIFNVTIGNKVIISKSDYQEFQKLSKVRFLKDRIEDEFYQDVKEEDLIVAMEKGIFDGLDDPYSQYYTKDEFKDLMEMTSGSYVGVGIVVSPGEDGFITVVAPIEDTPAEKAGILPGDKITKVDKVKYSAKEMDKAISIIKGEPGKDVVLSIIRENKPEFDITIKREQILIKSVKSEMMDEIGYMRISSFDERTGEEFDENLLSLKNNNPKGLIIDLRDNPGGLLNQVKEVADSILGEATIVYTEDRAGNRQYLKSNSSGKLDIPLVILVNENSASASEILAGAVRDNKAGTLVGTTTFGKGLVQNVVPLKDGSGYKITMAQYFTPNGEYINEKGITPEYVVEIGEEDTEDVQLNKAIEVIREKNK